MAQYAKTISLRSVKVCRVAVSATHKIPGVAKYILEDRNHVLYYRTAQQYERIRRGIIDKDEEGLWLVVGSNAINRKRVVRCWARRRILHAIVQQLKVHGFDRKGRKLNAESPVQVDGHQIERLTGLVDVNVHECSIDCNYEELWRQTGILVQEVVRRCGERRGQPGIPTQDMVRRCGEGRRSSDTIRPAPAQS